MITQQTTSGSAPVAAALDDLARSLGDGSLSRRRALTLVGAGSVGGMIGPLAQREDAGAKKKKKKKKKKKGNNTQQPPVTPGTGILGPPYACPTNGADCGGVCVCQLTKENTQICQDVVNAPGGNFELCNATVDCPSGQVCAASGSFCRIACPTA
jgi:hypothetical protein